MAKKKAAKKPAAATKAARPPDTRDLSILPVTETQVEHLKTAGLKTIDGLKVYLKSKEFEEAKKAGLRGQKKLTANAWRNIEAWAAMDELLNCPCGQRRDIHYNGNLTCMHCDSRSVPIGRLRKKMVKWFENEVIQCKADNW